MKNFVKTLSAHEALELVESLPQRLRADVQGSVYEGIYQAANKGELSLKVTLPYPDITEEYIVTSLIENGYKLSRAAENSLVITWSKEHGPSPEATSTLN